VTIAAKHDRFDWLRQNAVRLASVRLEGYASWGAFRDHMVSQGGITERVHIILNHVDDLGQWLFEISQTFSSEIVSELCQGTYRFPNLARAVGDVTVADVVGEEDEIDLFLDIPLGQSVSEGIRSGASVSGEELKESVRDTVSRDEEEERWEGGGGDGEGVTEGESTEEEEESGGGIEEGVREAVSRKRAERSWEKKGAVAESGSRKKKVEPSVRSVQFVGAYVSESEESEAEVEEEEVDKRKGVPMGNGMMGRPKGGISLYETPVANRKKGRTTKVKKDGKVRQRGRPCSRKYYHKGNKFVSSGEAEE
jgi:hypothetical protein